MMAAGGKIIVCLILIRHVLGANILYVAPIASPSHHIWNKALAMGLVQKGYNVTMISHDTEKLPLPDNFTLITMEGMYDVLHNVIDMEELVEETILGGVISLYEYDLFACEYDYNTTGLQTLLNYPKDYKFDLIIFDATIGRYLYPLIERFHNPPTVAVTPFLIPPVLATVFGKHLYTAYTPFYSTTYTNKMNLGERVFNFFYTYAEVFYRNYIFLPKEDALIREHFKNYRFSLDELERNISLLLCNTDPVLEYPEAFPPNIIPVGGLHARPANPLPKDLQKIADEAKDGIILFSLGTNVRSDQLDSNIRRAFLDAFSKIPQVVLWKFETDTTDDLPKNVIIRKWLPQNDILAHPNTKLFISHGGALSTQEAMFHGVPVIGMPFFADQHINIRKMEQKGIAKGIDRKALTSEIIHNVLNQVLTSTKYINNMRSLSKKYHDQPQTALERGVFWIEYVLRHGSAEHLVSVARDIPTYQSVNLDVLLIFILALGLLYLLLSRIIDFCRVMITSRFSRNKLKKN